MSNPLKLASLLMLCMALGYAANTAYKLVINGKSVAGQAIVVNGQTYVPLAALKAAGVQSDLASGTLSLTLPSVAGGANQLSALQGCLGQTLFNGIWRVRATKLEPIEMNGQKGYGVTVEWRNATRHSLTLAATNLRYGEGDIALALEDGSTVNMYRYDYGWVGDAVPQAAPYTHQIQFFTDSPAKPSKLILRIEPIAKDSRAVPPDVRYTVPDPSLRIDLTCTE
ncbi:hypothetical protein [Meiothermus granaticius]|uniref:Copper amine oxidase-like N-terminal domain-containing protein n=1 Tax=Meiothermus granaticius NBRC 107808 TaxID=1227551 RepID=A0A399F6T6_9DEIN|nr:hypothetical protein [Meiothermus granaticius]RIH91445.1 hypothetical protein Mgrana_02672 [Meiothermus granaticius NBRC 107808]GEM88311.1 hypothetical protein MGR01S_29360 [Meiothermus granaticius NBRC 107808]